MDDKSEAKKGQHVMANPNPKKKKKRKLPPYQVFVSHATSDKYLAMLCCEKIEAITGATTFRDDRDIKGGESIPDEIRGEIRRSRELVVLVTPNSFDRAWVLIEVGAAWLYRKDYHIVPVLCHVGADKIPDMLKAKTESLADSGS